jgi:hypothetical protein
VRLAEALCSRDDVFVEALERAGMGKGAFNYSEQGFGSQRAPSSIEQFGGKFSLVSSPAES